MPIRYVVQIILTLYSAAAANAELYDMNRVSVRAMGMGNAYTSIATNADALFYNPAGLARNDGVTWTIFDAGGGFSNLAKLANATAALSGEFFDLLDALYGEHVWLGGHGRMAAALPNMAAAYYTTADISFSVDNPSIPALNANVIYDSGLAAGGGLGIIPGLHIGAVLKSISRTGTRQTFGVTSLGTLDFDSIASSFTDAGQGFSIDVGANLIIESPVTPILSFVARNMGGTSFLSTSDGIPDDAEEYILGAALVFDLPILTISPAIDLRYFGQEGIDFGRRLNFGVEVDMPVIDLRAGFHQGYLSYGAGISLGLIQMDIASYGVELGQYAGQLEDRRYVMSFKMELGVDLGFGSTSSGSGSGSKGGAGSKRLPAKQRR